MKDNTRDKYLLDSCKLLWHTKYLRDFLEGRQVTPILLDIGLHKGCNIDCIYCYRYEQKPSNKYIPTVHLLNLANDAHALGVKAVSIIGDGEPTLNKGLYPFVQALATYGIDIGLATNGILLDDDSIRMLTSACTWIRFTMSAGQPKAYTDIHRTSKSNFYKLISNIELAVTYRDLFDNCTIGLQMVLLPHNIKQVIPLSKLAIKLGVDYLVIKQFSYPGNAIPVKVDMNSYERMSDILRKAEVMSNEDTKIIVKWSAIQDSVDITGNKKRPFSRCIDLPLLFQISGNGKCYPCGYLFGNSRYCYGDITRERLRDIVYSAHTRKIITDIAGMDLDKLCTGQCRHTETNKFMERLVNEYKNTDNYIDAMCNMYGIQGYEDLLNNPPSHINFI